MTIINELQLSKDLIRFPSVTPKDAGAIKFLSQKLKKLLMIQLQQIYFPPKIQLVVKDYVLIQIILKLLIEKMLN